MTGERVRMAGRLMSGCAALALMAAVAAAPAFAQTTPPGAAAPVGQQAADFLNAPSQLLTQFPQGGPEMITRVREIAVADAATLPVIMGQLATANPDQKTAIGSGLAQAARIVVRTNQAYALQIQQAIANTKDQEVVLAFAAVSGDRPIGATGGGNAGGGAVGGQTSALPAGANGGGSLQGIGNGGTATGPFTYTSSVSGLSGSLSAAVSP